jgi:hypothetical protein
MMGDMESLKRSLNLWNDIASKVKEAESVPESEWDVYHLREAIREMIAAEEHLVSGGKLEMAREIRSIRKKLEDLLVERLRK